MRIVFRRIVIFEGDHVPVVCKMSGLPWEIFPAGNEKQVSTIWIEGFDLLKRLAYRKLVEEVCLRELGNVKKSSCFSNARFIKFDVYGFAITQE